MGLLGLPFLNLRKADKFESDKEEVSVRSAFGGFRGVSVCLFSVSFSVSFSQ